MTVFIGKLNIRNFRSCIDSELELSRYTALIGRNNCGKSNCLTALQWLIRKATLGLEDFNNTDFPIEVVGELRDIQLEDLGALEASHRRRIEPYVRDGKLIIRRSQADPSAKPELAIFDSGANEWLPNPTGIDQALQALFPDPIRIGAMDDAEEDASKAKTTTTIGKLLLAMLNPIREQHGTDLAAHLGQVFDRLSATGGQRFEEIGRIDDSINAKIADLFPGMSIKLDFPVPEIQDLIKAGTVRVFEGDEIGRSFGFYGHGAQRAIQMALVRHLAELRRGDEVAGGATLLLVDEPELYMHPFAVEQVREALRSLSDVGYQVVFSTHSGQMVLSADARNALLMTKILGHGTRARPRLHAIIERLVTEPGHQLAQLFSLTNSAQILFADKVVLTEGKSELRLLPTLFKAISGRSLGQASIALVAQSGANDTAKSMEILDAMGLPACAVVDLDYAFRGASSHGLLQQDDPDLAACKVILAQMAEEGSIGIDPTNGLPTNKSAPVSAAKAFELLAANASARLHIAALVEKLRAHRIWLWPGGAIEAHLGIAAKKESEWLAFQLRCDAHGIDGACADAGSVRSLVDWLLE